METILQLFDVLRNLDQYLNHVAHDNLVLFYAAVFVIVFAETGLVITPFLPGDSLLFALGALAATVGSPLSMPLLLGLLVAAAVLGDAVNYSIGYRVGPAVFRAERSWLFNRRHLLRAQAFYEKYGSKTIILARFVPIVRTFAPFVAGVGKMEYRRFATYNVVGAVAWVMICTWAGYFFGAMPWVSRNFELVLVAIVVISVLPMAVEFALHRFRREKGEAAEVLTQREAA